MSYLSTGGRLLAGGAKLVGKAAATTTIATVNLTLDAAKFIRSNRAVVGNAAIEAAKFTAKATFLAAKLAGKGLGYVSTTAYDHRDVIAGTGIGLAKGAGDATVNLSAHIGNDDAVRKQTKLLEDQGLLYQSLTDKIAKKLGDSPSKALLGDTILVGGNTLAYYIGIGTAPRNIQEAYEMAYPVLAAHHSFIEELRRLDASQLQGFAAGLKGKLFEIEYTGFLNDGNLPAGFHAEMAHSATNPGWDIAIFGVDGAMRDAIQLKATDSVSYVREALDRYPNIDVITTSEVQSHLMMMGAAEHVADSHMTNMALSAAVDNGIDQAVGTMHWTPSVISLALLAFSAYSMEGVTNYEKSKSFGERSVKSYIAYLAGGAIAMATGTVYLGIVGGMGSRYLLGSGKKKRDKLMQMKTLVRNNECVLKNLALHA